MNHKMRNHKMNNKTIKSVRDWRLRDGERNMNTTCPELSSGAAAPHPHFIALQKNGIKKI